MASRSYRENILDLLQASVAPIEPFDRVLDFGSGDGWFSRRLLDLSLAREVVSIDVHRRTHVEVEPMIYDGDVLPFDDMAFDLVLAVDVIHHTPDHLHTLSELRRCSSKYVLLKDHNHEGFGGRVVLSVLDEIGNRRFGVPSLHRYQEDWSWLGDMEQSGWRTVNLVHPAKCETRPPLSWFVNRFHFVGLWERSESLPG